jgi:hypothetical protein
MQITVAIDAMGGDHGPKVIIPAALKALELNQELHIILVGLSSAIEAELNNLQQMSNLKAPLKIKKIPPCVWPLIWSKTAWLLLALALATLAHSWPPLASY